MSQFCVRCGKGGVVYDEKCEQCLQPIVKIAPREEIENFIDTHSPMIVFGTYNVGEKRLLKFKAI